MKKLSSQQIRETWLNFFHERGHMIEPGASLIPQNDPSLLWINAGVAALKKYFDGSKIPECKRITNVQKCIRTNDIDNVGKTARHHTFFEMLGNFSIGDYFRKEIIPWAFEILTSKKYFDMDKDKLYVTYHPADTETKQLWVKAGLDETHLIPLEDNYWQIGEGPCGPNTEVFFDRGEKYDSNNIGIRLLKDDIENDRYIEIWGIVFSQFNAVNGEKRENYKELPHKNIDTGAGLERIACVLQEKETNFETDLFMPYIEKVKELSSKPYEGEYLMAYRVIADHIRACTFALADGEQFSNEGRGYVLRRLLRRAMRYGQKLGLYEPFMYKIVETVIDTMKDFYPYLIEKKEYLEKIIYNEELKFLKTLQSGENILYASLEGKNKLSGETAFKLYDTYGFPIELTIEICNDKGIEVDVNRFNELLNEQKEKARNSRKIIESFNKQSKDLLEFNEKSTYLYDDKDIKSKVIGLFKDGNKVDKITDFGEICFKETNFYAEMGGQVSDKGYIENDNFRANVINVSKAPNGQHIHSIQVLYGEVKIGDLLSLCVDHIRHENIKMNHSATHLLQSALIQVLGDGVKQKGSYVDENYLRFDFSYSTKVDDKDLLKVEKIVNEYINESIEEKTLILPIEEAKKVGAIAEFNEKYGDMVRVVCFGNVSKEFCGGNHVENTHEIGVFVIESEEAISSGVRRIQARSGINAYHLLKERELILRNAQELLNSKSYKEIETRIKTLNDEIKNKDLENKNLLESISKYEFENLKNSFFDSRYGKTLISYQKNNKKDGLMNLYDKLKSLYVDDEYLIILIGDDKEKHPVIVGTNFKKSATFKANDIIKTVTETLGGSGGGRPDLSQGNVLDISKLDELKKIL